MRIVVAFDGTNSSLKALDFAFSLKKSVEKYDIVFAFPSFSTPPPTFDGYIVPPTESDLAEMEKYAEKVMDIARSRAGENGINADFEELDVPQKDVAEMILVAAQNFKADLIVMGKRRLTSMEKLILGSVSSEVVKKSIIPVLIVPPSPESK
ncbi:MAG: universal stress protein [Candidatus Thermoplasmatota archaeon]|nr:universal stress protein [Candidatus Thermoplasmatota archaeon]